MAGARPWDRRGLTLTAGCGKLLPGSEAEGGIEAIMPETSWVIPTASPEATGAFGCRLGSLLRPGDVVFLLGDLGAGKTRLAQGIAAGLGAFGVRSPSFTLLRRSWTAAGFPFYHADLYRLCSRDELCALDLAALGADGVLAVEWPHLAAPDFPERLEIEISFVPGRENARSLGIRPIGSRYEALVREMMAVC